MTGESTPRASAPAAGEELLAVSGLVKHFPIHRGALQRQAGAVRAVRGGGGGIRRCRGARHAAHGRDVSLDSGAAGKQRLGRDGTVARGGADRDHAGQRAEADRADEHQGEQDDEAFLEVNNAAFAGHPENGGWDADDFAERRALDWFRPDDLLMTWRGDELLGFHWTKWHGHESDEHPAHEPVGEVYVLAVHPRAQGLGLGRGLLQAGVHHLYQRGCRQAILYVDCASPTAVRLYESAGFAHEYLDVCYEQWIDSAVDGATRDLLRPAY